MVGDGPNTINCLISNALEVGSRTSARAVIEFRNGMVVSEFRLQKPMQHLEPKGNREEYLRHGRGFYQIKRASLHFLINAPEIFAEHADRHQLHATQEKQERYQRGEPGEGHFEAQDPA